MARRFKIAAAHVAPILMDPMATAVKAAEWIAKAGQDAIDLVVFPEVFIPGLSMSVQLLLCPIIVNITYAIR